MANRLVKNNCSIKVMNKIVLFSLIIVALLLGTASCQHDEPANRIKPESERTFLFLTPMGEIYDINGKLVIKLPECNYACGIISDKNDYFVSGISNRERVGYWKNGKWNTLHVDFVDDVDHWIDGIGKWDYYLYLLDYPNVLKNSGIFPLEDSDNFLPAQQGLAVSEGKCYVVGSKKTETSGGYYLPTLYTEHKGRYTYEMLPVSEDAILGDCTCVYAYNTTHTVIGGSINGRPVMWVDKQLQVLPLSEPVSEENEFYNVGGVIFTIECNGEIYAFGTEPLHGKNSVVTIWHNGNISHLEYDPEHTISSDVVGVVSYGDDIYVATVEYSFNENDEYTMTTVLWKNGSLVKSFVGVQTSGFTIV